jgi:hypothetical protein
MSNKVRERLRKLMLELNHEERQQLDKAMVDTAIRMGAIIISDNPEKACDEVIDKISDEQLKKMVQIVKKKKKKMLVEA